MHVSHFPQRDFLILILSAGRSSSEFSILIAFQSPSWHADVNLGLYLILSNKAINNLNTKINYYTDNT